MIDIYIYNCTYTHTFFKISYYTYTYTYRLPTIWTDGKAEVGRVREGKSGREKIKEARKSEKKEDAVVRKGRKVAIHCFYPMIWWLRRVEK